LGRQLPLRLLLAKNLTNWQLAAYFVEKLGIHMKVMVVASHLARCDLLDVPSSVQMMGFGG